MSAEGLPSLEILHIRIDRIKHKDVDSDNVVSFPLLGNTGNIVN